MARGISLANKCQLLFGVVVVVILAAALTVPWVRTRSLVDDMQFEVARTFATAWLAAEVDIGNRIEAFDQPPAFETLVEDAEGWQTRLHVVTAERLQRSEADEDLQDAFERVSERERREHTITRVVEGDTLYRYVRGLNAAELSAVRSGRPVLRPVSEADTGPVSALLVVDQSNRFAKGQLLTSQVYIIAAWLGGVLAAVLAFYLILTRIILRPVRKLRETTERVQEGDFTIRSEMGTGDEFEQLSDAFNAMLDRVEQSQAQLRSMNESLDLKVNELAEANVGLFESNRFKSEFLANVSHELRTPLNSIIGFTELLNEIAMTEGDTGDPKRRRYIANILTSGRSLLEMINELLDLAKIEAGRMEVNVESTSVADVIEGLVNIMRPQSESGGLTLGTSVGGNVPMIETDPGKLQQILYNFLSNAIKFTPAGGSITISADRVTRQDNSLGVRVAVSDTGPGIPEDMQDVIFDKFRQLDASHTREHAGTGLGLAICRELAELLGATVSFVSKPGEGAKFFVDLPQAHQPDEPQALMA
jgi:signal transduction histidine kinase